MTRVNSTHPLYREIQHFRQIWVWALVLFISLLAIYGLVQQLIINKPFGNNPAPDIVLLITAIILGLGLPIFLYTTNLSTKVHADGLYIRFFPFHLSFRRIAANDIKGFEVRTYSPIREYGGWGIRFGRKGKAYNVSGNRGVQLELSDGKQLLIGSQKPEELAKALNITLGEHE
jgi:hypothetical protein